MTENNNGNANLSSPFRGTGGIFLLGFMGSGKSFWGRQIAVALALPFIDLDTAIEEREGRSIATIFAESGEPYFREREAAVLNEIMAAVPAYVMATGGGTACHRNSMDLMNKKGLTVWLDCTVDTLAGRLEGERDKRPLLRDKDGPALRAFIAGKLQERIPFYQQAQVQVKEADLQLETLVAVISKNWNI